ncbi:TetR/AcrR family transcriptional regulator [Kineococcus sp. DHX-1]|uniref:TetR/AcrR family transcriptional regulator n=1 Tax=Kineococcus sp. DHX-1 TaxID=3349638 RepID=UPI0036D42C92
MDDSTSLRERTRRAVAGEISAAAFDLFVEQGFEATTVDQIAAAAGLSRRSFFRYFATKEDVLLQSLDATGRQVASALSERPSHEEPWTALRHCFDALVQTVDSDPDRSFVLLRMLLSSPALRGAHLAKQAAWQELLIAALLERSGGGAARAGATARLRAHSLASAALACLEAAQVAWVEDRSGSGGSGGRRSARRLSSLLDEAMGSVRGLQDAPGGGGVPVRARSAPAGA